MLSAIKALRALIALSERATRLQMKASFEESHSPEAGGQTAEIQASDLIARAGESSKRLNPSPWQSVSYT